MTWQEAAAQLGMTTLVGEMKALKRTMKRGEYKRLVSTSVAQLLELHPDVRWRKARRWARRATGTKPAKQAGLSRIGTKEAVAAAGVAAATAGVTKAAEAVGSHLREKVRKSAGTGRRRR